jgi:hypothetical protein
MVQTAGFDMPGEEPGTCIAVCTADPSTIDKFVLSVRNLQWIKVRGISLYPRGQVNN